MPLAGLSAAVSRFWFSEEQTGKVGLGGGGIMGAIKNCCKDSWRPMKADWQIAERRRVNTLAHCGRRWHHRCINEGLTRSRKWMRAQLETKRFRVTSSSDRDDAAKRSRLRVRLDPGEVKFRTSHHRRRRGARSSLVSWLHDTICLSQWNSMSSILSGQWQSLNDIYCLPRWCLLKKTKSQRTTC